MKNICLGRNLKPVLRDELHELAGILMIADAWSIGPRTGHGFRKTIKVDNPVEYARAALLEMQEALLNESEPTAPTRRPSQTRSQGSPGS